VTAVSNQGDHWTGTLAQTYSEKILCRYQSLNDARGDNSPFFTLRELQDIHSSEASSTTEEGRNNGSETALLHCYMQVCKLFHVAERQPHVEML
jgi:hypothetical protein